MIKEKNIILCADDYGLSPEINTAIINLAAKQRISAVSCMVNMPYCDPKPLLNRKVHENVSIGLHLDLSEKKSSRDFRHLMLDSFLPKKNRNLFTKEITNQITLFEKKFGFLPEFIDGHQHVHQFNHINKSLISVLEKKQFTFSDNFWIRSVSIKPFQKYARIKSCIIFILSLRSNKRLKKFNINSSFFGLNSFESSNQQEMFSHWMKHSKNNGLIMCHPSMEKNPTTTVASGYREYTYLASTNFEEQRKKMNITLRKDIKHD